MFGELPLGLPLRLFVFLFFSLLFLPVPFGSWHAFRILFRDASGGFGKAQIVRAILSTPSVHRDLRRARAIVVGIGLFYLALMAAWIWYADSRGI
ncbi:MAG: hypothetical protein U1A78_01135 [Polyangia bacterium]